MHDAVLPDGVEGPVPPPPVYDSKLHMALGYQPDTRMLPFGALVWCLNKTKDPKAPKSFEPTGIPALYVGPEVLPAMRCKDVHHLFDLADLTSYNSVRLIVTKDFAIPTGRWVFPLTSVPMLKSILPENPQQPAPALDDEPDSIEEPRNRSITRRRLAQYGPTDLCDGCLLGTYSHSPECRSRFNKLLDSAEPLVVVSGGGSIDGRGHGDLDLDESMRMFDVRVEDGYDSDYDSLDGWKPQFPLEPRGTEGSEYTPSSPRVSEPDASLFDEQLGEFLPVPGGVIKKVGKVKGTFIEFCCEENSSISRVADILGIAYLGITKESLNIQDDDAFQQLLFWLQEEIQDGNGPIHLWSSLPCTVWSPWQRMAIAKYGSSYKRKLQKRRAESLEMVKRFRDVAEMVKLSRGGSVTFEWSRDSEGWDQPLVKDTMVALDLQPVRIDGCAFGLAINGKHPQRPWLVQTDNKRLVKEFQHKKCKHEKGFHDSLEGSLTTKSGIYNVTMATSILTTLFPGVVADLVPAMPVLPFKLDPHRARLHDFHTQELCVLGTIHKLLTRAEMRSDPKALQAIWEEGQGVRAKDVWDDNSVMEKSERISQAQKDNKVIHIADVMPIASIKFWETPSKRKYKGRLVFRGDQVKDSWGGPAQFGAMFSTPTNTQAINLAVFYGLLLGNELKAADCTRAFLQAMLLMKEETFVVLPQELWLPGWAGKYKQPTVRLRKALYGHPLASACWDLHLRQVLQGDLGLLPMEGHPSVYYCPKTFLLVVIYVDDVLVSGPKAHQSAFWKELQRLVETDEVEDLNQFIGRNHELSEGQCVFNMVDYCQQAIDLYLEAAGNVSLRRVSTPYVNEGVLTMEDYQVQGQISHKASSVLMKLLWVCRLARPDLAYPIGMLATQVTRWSRNADKQLFRLVSYLHTTRDLCLVSRVVDAPSSCSLCLYVDADLGGCPFTAKSTSGLFLVITGPNGTFAPIAWSSRRQQHVARSTADSELNALSEGVHEELAPALMLLQTLLGKETPKAIVKEDNSAVVQSVRKGYSIKLRHLARTPKLSLASLNEACTTWCQLEQTPTRDQLGDIFTKALTSGKFDPQSIGLTHWPSSTP